MSRYSGLKDEHLLALGKVAVMGAQLERTLEMCLKVRLQLDEKQADKLIYKQNFAYKIELLTTLHPKDDDAEYQQELGQLTSKLGDLMTKRHTVIHADWEYEFDKPAKTVQEVYDRFIGNAKSLELSASKKKHG